MGSKRTAPGLKKEEKVFSRILILHTGGTISSKVSKTGGVDVSSISKKDKKEERTLFSILSENLNFVYLNKLIQEIQNVKTHPLQAIIITHGTDTLPYTACFLSFFFSSLSFPLFLVGAQKSPDRPTSERELLLKNIKKKISLFKCGVFVPVFSEKTKKIEFIPGIYCKKIHTSQKKCFIDLSKGCKSKKLERRALENISFSKKIGCIYPTPFTDISLFEQVLTRNKIIIFFGSGMGHLNEKTSSFLNQKKWKKKIFVIVSTCFLGKTNPFIYKTGRKLRAAGFIFSQLPSFEATFAKCSIGYKIKKKKFEEFLNNTNICGELELVENTIL